MSIYDEPLIRIRDGKGYQSSCHYVFSKEGVKDYPILNGNCHSSIHSQFSKYDCIRFYIATDSCCYSEDDLKRWIEYLRQASFSFTYEGIITPNYTERYYTYTKPSYVLRLDCKDYLNAFHVFCAVTIMRYIYYDYQYFNGGTEIPNIVFTLKKLFGDGLHPITAAILAHRISSSYDVSHNFGADDASVKFYTDEAFKAAVLKNGLINTMLNGGKEFYKDILQRIYSEKNWKELSKQINIPLL